MAAGSYVVAIDVGPGEGRSFAPDPRATRAYHLAEQRQEALYAALIG
ncbi:MAG TPA: hypothetical protein VIP57_08140 [Candidatus Dormibacteraeota bacterium]|jgi:hypothetical protein